MTTQFARRHIEARAPFVEAEVEIRRSKRYRLVAQATFWWISPNGVPHAADGTIRDISDRGVFVTGEAIPPEGARLDMDVYLPSLEVGGSKVHLRGEGKVVRVDRVAGGGKGFAAAMSFQAEGASGPTVVDPQGIQ